MDEIPPEHLKIELYPLRPPGGQHVGTMPYGVKITHLPTGLVAICEVERRSVHRCRQIAMDMLLGGLTSRWMPPRETTADAQGGGGL